MYKKMLHYVFGLALLLMPLSAQASTYGSGAYGNCTYQNCTPAASPNPSPTPAGQTPASITPSPNPTVSPSVTVEPPTATTLPAPTPSSQNQTAPNSAASNPVSAIVRAVTQAIKHTPPVVARSFPYFLFILLALLALILVLQTENELHNLHDLLAALKNEQLIAEEKDNFIMLSSHYLNTPLSVIRNGAELAVSLNEVPAESAKSLSTELDHLRAHVKDLLTQIENNEALAGIKAPDLTKASFRAIASPLFWLPVISVGALALGANWLFSAVGQISLGTINLITQAIVYGLAVAFVYFALRSRARKHAHYQNTQVLLAHQAVIDDARNKFIGGATGVLALSLREIEATLPPAADTMANKNMREGLARFKEILAKFELLSQVQSGRAGGNLAQVSLSELVDQAVVARQAAIDAKHLQIQTEWLDQSIKQNRNLFSFVIDSVVDNAVKFSHDGGIINISCLPATGQIAVTIKDNGSGIPPEKLPHLFKPFTRAESSLVFNYEGLGFSLFLDKIILDYLGGEITADSHEGRGTAISMQIQASPS